MTLTHQAAVDEAVRKARKANVQTRWTDADDAALMERIADGWSFEAAGRSIGKTKNSCIGRFHTISRNMGAGA